MFLHEGLGCIDMWKDFPAAIADATGCSTLLYDRLGHGNSDPEAAPRGVDFFETEAFKVLPAILNVAGIAPATMVLIGHSDGGTIALLYAGRFTVRGVITEAAHVFVDEISITGVTAANQAWRDTNLKQRLSRYHGANTASMFNAWSSMWLADWFRDWTIEATLPAILCPVLAIQGEDDEYGTIKQLDAIGRGVSGPVKILAVPNCGHTPHIKARDIVTLAMVRFIATVRTNC